MIEHLQLAARMLCMAGFCVTIVYEEEEPIYPIPFPTLLRSKNSPYINASRRGYRVTRIEKLESVLRDLIDDGLVEVKVVDGLGVITILSTSYVK
jgi:hypothetical protein